MSASPAQFLVFSRILINIEVLSSWKTLFPRPANDAFDVAMNELKNAVKYELFFDIDEPLNDFYFSWILADFQIAVRHIIFTRSCTMENGGFSWIISMKIRMKF